MPVGARFIPARIGENKKMTEHKKLQPEIRFAGFTDDWEQRKLEDVSFSYSGGTPSVNNLSFYGGSIPFIRSGEINDETTELFITEEGLNNSSAKLVEKGNILYALYGATSGEVGRAKIHGAINQAILAIVPYVNYDSEFIAQWLRRNKYSIISTYLQGGQGNLSGEIVKNLILELPPSKEEQTKIGNFFKQLDDTIALHQGTLEKYQKLKVSYLEKMFPKENELYPELRFPNFTDAWEQRKLGEFVSSLRSGLSRMLDSEDIGLPVIRANNINNGYVDLENDIKYWYQIDPMGANTRNYLVAKDDILINFINSESRMGSAAIMRSIPSRDTIYTTNILRLRLTSDLDPYWFYIQTQSKLYLEYIKSISKVAVNQASFTTVEFKNFTFFCPSTKEQTQIGNFFKQLDDTIALHQREVEKYKKIKQSYLEKMFI